MNTYDLGERALIFAKDVRTFFRKLPSNLINTLDGKQLIKSSGSMGANYLEANDALGDRDFISRLKIARKEAKESRYWLQLLKASNTEELTEEVDKLINEADELTKILSKMIINTRSRK